MFVRVFVLLSFLSICYRYTICFLPFSLLLSVWDNYVCVCVLCSFSILVCAAMRLCIRARECIVRLFSHTIAEFEYTYRIKNCLKGHTNKNHEHFHSTFINGLEIIWRNTTKMNSSNICCSEFVECLL